MKTWAAAAIAFALAQAACPASPRMLYWHTASAEAAAAFLARWESVRAACKERDLILRRVEEQKERLRLGIPAQESQMVLVGRDGQIKRRWPLDADPRDVFLAIDAMPMRQREIRERGGLP